MQFIIAVLVFPAYALVKFFNDHDPGGKEPNYELRNSALFGILALILTLALGYAAEFLFFGSGSHSIFAMEPGSAALFVNLLVHAGIEEVAKFVPLAIYIYKRPTFHEITDGIIYFTMCGLTFGVVESFLYSLQGGGIIAVLRVVVGLFFHAALTSFVGYYLAKAKMQHAPKWEVGLALMAAIFLHAVYNFGLFSSSVYPALFVLSLFISVMMNALLFWLYYKATETDVKEGFAHPAEAAAATPTAAPTPAAPAVPATETQPPQPEKRIQ